MPTIRKLELTTRIARQTGIYNRVVRRVVDGALEEIVRVLCEGKRLELRGFGVMWTRQGAARMGKNPKTMQRFAVASRRVVRFRVGRKGL